jgi:Gas vesicle synthesis protein GvpL/GvpF
MTSYLYIYAIAQKDAVAPAGIAAVANSDGVISAIPVGPLVVMVSPVEEPEIMAARRHMLVHTKALETIMSGATILPMRFGVIVDNADAIHEALAPKFDDLLAMLADLDGKIEAGIRASWNEARLYGEIVAARPDLATRAYAMKVRDPAAAYYDRIDLGRDVDSAMAVKRFEEKKALLARLKPFAVRHVDLPEQDDMNLMNVALLIERSREAELIAAIEAIDREEGDRLNLRVVSPAPVYNFVKLRIEFAPPTTSGQQDAA